MPRHVQNFFLNEPIRHYIPKKSAWPLGGIHQGINNGPNGYHNWAGNTPIQNLVDDYQMMDGSDFDWDNPEHAADPYVNRDPRLKSTILYDGADWKPRPSDVEGIDPNDQIQSGFVCRWKRRLNRGSGHKRLSDRKLETAVEQGIMCVSL